jgi:hypothetical protein
MQRVVACDQIVEIDNIKVAKEETYKEVLVEEMKV